VFSHGLFARIENHGAEDLHSVFNDSSFGDNNNLGLRIVTSVGEDIDDDDVIDVLVILTDGFSLIAVVVYFSTFFKDIGDLRDVNKSSKCSFRSSFSSIVFSFVSSKNPLSRPST